ncbi:Vacuolar protein sorting-associated protein [Actinidia chinensis var. chinensis]|uniref:Vacuolar protein sorting-associated protein n=1 Tax=Actinidia chinensis var. chinensis TaxID=1590841 RepID=A0A2R6Q3L7_ACTCC|nr:Vacuolar protein sorting-associated protein [Actinidia chinensis var. chinensis]
MGNCLTLSSSTRAIKALPIDTVFKLPSPIPAWSPGGGFGSGVIDLGGLQVCQITTFTKVWATYEGGPGDLGATFFEPSPIPDGFSMFGCYCQPNNQPLSGWVLVGKDMENESTLKNPIDYTLVWSSESLKIRQNGNGYVWLPVPPDGYRPVGHVITTSPNKPSLEKVRCVRSDLTDESVTNNWIWGPDSESSSSGFNVYSFQPSNRGTKLPGVSVGTFIAQNNASSTSTLSLACLKNSQMNLSYMPNLPQIEALFQAYSPCIYLHPKEIYLPSSVNWYFNNGALLYMKGDESNPVSIEPNGSNLPQGGSNDGSYWMGLPIDDNAKERLLKGDLESFEANLHVKPVLGATFTDIAVWVFYPFNGPATAKVELVDIPLGKIGEHVGDWEHLALRISNFNGALSAVYFSQHSAGTWVDASLLEFQKGNKPVTYSSRNGHAFYPKPGLVLQGSGGIGIRNDTAKSDNLVDTGARYSVISAEHLGDEIVEPPWLNYLKEWGPKVTYELGVEIEKVKGALSGNLKTVFERLVSILPDEVLGEEGPTGPKMKKSWDGDEVV